MIKPASLFCLIIIILVNYLNEGCNVFKPAPTPTPVPTATPIATYTPAQEPTKDPRTCLIIPGTGVADLEINKSTLGDVKKWLGDTNSNPTTEQGYTKIVYDEKNHQYICLINLPAVEQGYTKIVYNTQKLTFWFTNSKENTLKSILIESGSYTTAEGIGVGSNIFDVRKTYPKGVLDKDNKVYYTDNGMDYYYDAGNITSILLIDRDPFISNEKENTMVFIKGGTFQMEEKGKQKTVAVGDFYIGKYEVMNKEYCQFDSGHKGEWSNSDYPVESVTWNDAVKYCKWLSSKTGKNYRLPTEAEWEYACRAGSTTDYYWGDNNKQPQICPGVDEYAWYFYSYSDQVQPVGQKIPNLWGLYDMSGNVSEWCSDWYDSSHKERVLRGGSWEDYAIGCTSGYRHNCVPVATCRHFGFRVVRTP